MAPPSDADGGAPLRGRLTADTTATADARTAHHPVAHASVAPERRRPWMDLLRLVLKYVGDGVGQVLRRLMVPKNLEEPRDAGVVLAMERSGRREDNGGQRNYAFMYSKLPKCHTRVDELHNQNGPDAIKKSREERDDAGVVVNRDLAEESDREKGDGKEDVLQVCRSDERVHRNDPASQVSDTSTVATPASPLRVDGEPVWGEELRLFASYCQESLTCTKKILCHRCIFEPHKYCGPDKFAASNILLHSANVHQTPGLECKTCKARVRTPRELLLHAHFCHALKTGWWKLKLYKDKMKVTKAD